MRRKAFWVALPLVILLLLAGFWFGLKGPTLLQEVKQTATEELTRAFDTPVRVGQAELTGWNIVTLIQIEIYDRQERILAKIPTAVVEIDPVKLLSTRRAVASIARVALERPEAFLYRNPDGKWNIDELLTKDLPESRAFKGKVTLAEGQVRLREENRIWEVSPVAGTVDFSRNPAIQFRLNLRGQGKRARVFGTVLPSGEGVVTLQGQNQDLEDWQGLFPQEWPLADLKGTIQGLDVTLEKRKEGIRFAGEIRPSGISGQAGGFNWSEISGLVAFSDQVVHFHRLSAKMNGQPLSLAGKILQPTRDPLLDLKLKTEILDLAALISASGLTGTTMLETELKGPISSLQASGTVKISQGSFQGWTLNDFASPFVFRLEPAGWNLNINQAAGVLAGERLDSLQAMLRQSEGQLMLRGLWGRWGQGYIAADGQLGPAELALDLTMAELPLQALQKVYPELQASGALDFRGRVSGSPGSPRLAGQFQARQGSAFHQPFERALGGIELAGNTVALKSIEIRNGQGIHQIDGSVGLSGDRPLAMKIRTSRARAEDLAAWLAPGEALTGNLENEMTLAGSLHEMEVEGKFALWEGSYQGFLLTRVAGNYRYSKGVLSLDEVEVDSFNAKATISGDMDAKQRLNFAITAREVELGYIQFNYPYPVEGRVNLDGHLGGSLSKPEFQGALMSRNIKINGQDLFDIGGNLIVRRDEVQVSAVHFLLGKGLVRAGGGYRNHDQEIYGGLSVDDAEISSLLALFNTPVTEVSGRLSGQIALTGTVDTPALQIFGTMHGGRVRGYLLDAIDLNVSLRNHVFSINELRARQGSGFVAARGTADLKGPLALEIGGRDIDAGILAAWLNTKTEIQGKMNFLAQIGGTAQQPQAGLSLDIRSGGVANATFDELFGLLVLKDGVVQINQLFITKGEHRASAYGSAPLAALDRRRRDAVSAGEQMDVRFRLDQANLSILPLLSPEVEWARGETKGEVHVGGIIARPIFSGQIQVADGALKLKSLLDPLEKLGVDIRFQDDKMNVNRIGGVIGGGSAELKGTLTLNGDGMGAYAAELTLDRPMIRHKAYKGPLNGKVALTRQNGKPLISGLIRFENASLNILGIPETPKTELDTAMDLQVEIGRNVRAYSPSLYDIWLGGGLHFGGSLQQPEVKGKVLLTRGSIEYMGARFRIAEGTVDFPSRRSLDPLIHLEAYANLSRTKVMLNIDGAASQMELKLSSIPALSPQEIRTVLALRPRSGETLPPGSMSPDDLAREEMRALLTSGLRMQVFGDFENSFRDALGLDDFRLVSSTRTTAREPVGFGSSLAAGKPASLQEVYTLEFSKYIGDRVEVTYSMGLNRSEYLAAIRYDLNQAFSLNASVDEKNKPRFGAEYRLRF